MEEDREVIRASSIIAPLIILTSLVLLNYVINGLPYIPDSWVHIAHSETILRTGYLFGPSQNPSMVSYNYKWPTVNLLLALSQSVLGLGPLEAFYVVSILASLSIVPFVLFVRRLTGSDVVALITGLLFAVLSVKLLVDSSVMKETAAQYPFYAYVLATYMALMDRKHFRQNLVVMVLAFIAILFAHHFTLLMALAYSFVMAITVLMSNYLSGGGIRRGLYVVITVIALGLLTYLWYMDYLRAYTVTSFVTPGLVTTPILIALLLIDYAAMRRRPRILIYASLTIPALALIVMFSMGRFLPYVLEGFNRAVALSSIPYVLPILIAVLYLALYGLEKPVIAATTVISLAILLYVLLMGNNPLELLFLSKSLDFVMPFLLIPTALVITSAMRRRSLLKVIAYVIVAALVISLPMFSVLTLYTYSLPVSSTLTVYRVIDYEELNAICGLIPRSSTLYSSVSYESMIMFMMGINASDPTTYLLHGEAPPGLLIITERNVRVGFLYGSGYSMVSIPSNYLFSTIARDDLVYSSRTLWAYSWP